MKVWCKKISKINKGLDAEKVVIGLLVLITLVSGGILASTRVKADDSATTVVDEINVVIPVACSMSSTSSSNNVYTETVTADSYTPNIGDTRIRVFCNDFAGFSVYAVGFTNDTIGNNTMATSTTPAQTISTGTATSGNTSAWAMRLTKVTNTSGQADITYGVDNLAITDGTTNYNGVYRTVPATYTKVATYTNNNGPATTDTILGSNIDARYAVFVSATQPAGTYEGKVKYMLVHPATMEAGTYTLAYNANGGAGAMASETNLPNYQEHAIKANTFTAPNGYMFAGWCTVQDTTASGVVQGANPQTTCNGDSYLNNGTLPASPSVSATAGGTLTLYAYWKEVPTLYDEVAVMSKGKQTLAQLQKTIAVPTSADRTEDTSNSGVYEYDPSVFGTVSDAASTSTIYYYRGVLEKATSSYGSNGSAVTYPNYVVLSSASDKSNLANTDTCWRIVRTTGSGGVKMIYNGTWTGSTCANARTNAQVITSTFNNSSASNGYSSLAYQNIHAVGYTYNNAVTGVGSASADTTIAKVFGSSSDYSVNSSNSIIKQYIEQTWFSNISAYESILEPNAGYCNDRTLYPDGSYTLADKLAESTQIVPYGSSGMTVYYFGAYARNMSAAQTPTLECPRGVVDIYSTTTASGGNGQLSKPAALLTADELSFAGSGSSTGSTYNANSYLRSGNSFWLLSPNSRSSDGIAYEFTLLSDGYLDNRRVNYTYGVRPAISLKPGTTATSGTGIATDPWVVTAP